MSAWRWRALLDVIFGGDHLQEEAGRGRRYFLFDVRSRAGGPELVRKYLGTVVPTGKLDLDSPNHLGRLEVFASMYDLPTGVKCAIPPWHTLHAEFNSVARAST
jgi:hypothetical protein